jgi:hypothetical protein
VVLDPAAVVVVSGEVLDLEDLAAVVVSGEVLDLEDLAAAVAAPAPAVRAMALELVRAAAAAGLVVAESVEAVDLAQVAVARE